jgi:hypothetical protein
MIAPAASKAPAPKDASARLVAEVYRPHQRPVSAQPYDLRSFAYGGPMGWFHLIAHKIDLLVRPTFALITEFVNVLLRWIWYGVQRIGGSAGSRAALARTAAPELRPGSPAATLVCMLVVLFVTAGLARPIVWPAQPEPRAFGSPAANPSNLLKATNPWQRALDTVADIINGPGQAAPEAPQPVLATRPPGDHDLRGAPTISAAQIDKILNSYGSPATGSGAAWVAMGEKYGIDPAYAVAFFIHESSAGTNPGWAGIKPGGATTHNIGNIICAGYPTCYGRFRDYPSWEAGIDDWYKLISVEYIQGRGTTTVAEIIPIYAPSFENDTQGYIRIVEQMVDGWRSGGV